MANLYLGLVLHASAALTRPSLLCSRRGGLICSLLHS